MTTNRIAEGVGKKIVEALKQQSDMEIQNIVENPAPIEETVYNEEPVEYSYENNSFEDFNTEYQQPINQSIMTSTTKQQLQSVIYF